METKNTKLNFSLKSTRGWHVCRSSVDRVELYMPAYSAALQQSTACHQSFFKTGHRVVNSYVEDLSLPSWLVWCWADINRKQVVQVGEGSGQRGEAGEVQNVVAKQRENVWRLARLRFERERERGTLSFVFRLLCDSWRNAVWVIQISAPSAAACTQNGDDVWSNSRARSHKMMPPVHCNHSVMFTCGGFIVARAVTPLEMFPVLSLHNYRATSFCGIRCDSRFLGLSCFCTSTDWLKKMKFLNWI